MSKRETQASAPILEKLHARNRSIREDLESKERTERAAALATYRRLVTLAAADGEAGQEDVEALRRAMDVLTLTTADLDRDLAAAREAAKCAEIIAGESALDAQSAKLSPAIDAARDRRAAAEAEEDALRAEMTCLVSQRREIGSAKLQLRELQQRNPRLFAGGAGGGD